MERRTQLDRPAVSPFAAAALYLLAMAGLLLAGPAFELLIAWTGAGLSSDAASLALNIFYYGLFMLLPVALCAHRTGNAIDALRLNPVSVGMMVRIAIVAVLCMMIAQNVTLLWMALWQALGLDVFAGSAYVRPSGTSGLMFSVLSAAVIAPVCEELLFRGALLGAWERRDRARAIAVSTLLFAMSHGSLLGLPAELLAGELMALLVLWTDSLYAGMIFHSAYNAAALILQYVSSAPGLEVSAEETALMQADVVAYLGGAPALLTIVLDIVLMLALVIALVRKICVRAIVRDMQIAQAAKEELSRASDGTPGPAPGCAKLPAGEILVLMAAVVTALFFYLGDLLPMLGVQL